MNVALEEIREDGHGAVMGYYAKGHYDRQVFARHVEQWANASAREDAEWTEAEVFPIRVPVLSVRHVWWRKVPSREYGEYDGAFLLHSAKPHARGAFAATVTEHRPLAGWDGENGRLSGQSCWCPACGHPQRWNETSRRLYERRNRHQQWQAAAHPERYRHDVVLHGGGDGSFPCYNVAWDDLDAPHVRSFLARIGHAAPSRRSA